MSSHCSKVTPRPLHPSLHWVSPPLALWRQSNCNATSLHWAHATATTKPNTNTRNWKLEKNHFTVDIDIHNHGISDEMPAVEVVFSIVWQCVDLRCKYFYPDLKGTFFSLKIYYIFSREIPGFIQWIKVISSQVLIFTLWKYQKCYFHGVKITSDCDVTSGTKIWEKHVEKNLKKM